MTTHERPDAIESAIYSGPARGPVRGPIRGPFREPANTQPDTDITVSGFDDHGRPIDEGEEMVAKSVESPQSTRYFALFSTSGADIGRMLNPVGLYFNQDDVKRDQKKTGKARYEFKEVPRAAFLNYLMFLQNRIESFLRTAERLVLDA